MQFQVPQFIEVEDKIFGPLTFKQFIYIIGSAGLAYILWRILPIYIGAPLVLASLGLGAALAFLQWNGRPFITGLENSFYYFLRAKLYLWNNERRERKSKKEARDQRVSEATVYVPRLSESRLSELAWSLDIKERIASGVASGEERERYEPRSDVVAPVRTAQSALVR